MPGYLFLSRQIPRSLIQSHHLFSSSSRSFAAFFSKLTSSSSSPSSYSPSFSFSSSFSSSSSSRAPAWHFSPSSSLAGFIGARRSFSTPSSSTSLPATFWKLAIHSAKPVSVNGTPLIGGLLCGTGLLLSLKGSPLLAHVNSQAMVTQERARGVAILGSALGHIEAKRAADLAAMETKAKLKAAQSGKRRWLRDFFLVIFRATFLFVLFLPVLVVGILALLFPKFTLYWLDLLLRTLETAGPAFIKLGQWITTRPDIFPSIICETLEKLHDNVHPHSAEETRKTIEDAFSVPFFELFLEFDPIPLGVGCVAQVHKATLSPPYRTHDNPTGQVAVKVVHLRAIDQIEKDLKVIKFFAGALNFCFPSLKWAGFSNSVNVFTTFLATQLDLNVEARNMTRFRKNFKDSPHIVFAKPYLPLVSERVLVESFQDGVSIANFLKVKGPWNSKIASIGLDAFLKMALIDNFVHADLHPGNIFVLLDETKKSPIKMIFLDCGLVSELSKVDQENFVALFNAVAHGQGRRAAELMIERTTGDRSKMIDPEGFVNEMDGLITMVMKHPLTEIKIGDVLGKVISLVRKHQVPLETNTTNLIMGIVVLEGIGKQLDPSIDIFDCALDLLHKERVDEGFKELDTWVNRVSLMARKVYKRVFGTKEQISEDRL